MNEAIAYMAKDCPFDAAHYTWVFVDKSNFTQDRLTKMEERMLAHGDYAAPLRTRDLKHPFENMAVVINFDAEELSVLSFFNPSTKLHVDRVSALLTGIFQHLFDERDVNINTSSVVW